MLLAVLGTSAYAAPQFRRTLRDSKFPSFQHRIGSFEAFDSFSRDQTNSFESFGRDKTNSFESFGRDKTNSFEAFARDQTNSFEAFGGFRSGVRGSTASRGINKSQDPPIVVAQSPYLNENSNQQIITRKCKKGEILKIDGTCAAPKVRTKSIFSFVAPPTQVPRKRLEVSGEIPDPEIDYNIVFVRTPEQPEKPEPLIVPPPQQQTVVYVLTKDEDSPIVRDVIEAPRTPPVAPEVFYVNYKDGERPELPGGLDVDDAFNKAKVGQVIKDKSTKNRSSFGSRDIYQPPSSFYGRP